LNRKLTESSGLVNRQVLAFTRWYYPYTLTPSEKEAHVGEDIVPSSYTGVAKEFWSKLYDGRRANMDNEKDYFVDILVVLPGHQRKGYGRLMLEHGLKIVDAEGAKCYIEATAEGLGLYEALGWQRIDKMEVDLAEHGKGKGERWFLMRPAKKS